jgi:pSer/pThr/pTyr-binding forkhead associated (FHA) protein
MDQKYAPQRRRLLALQHEAPSAGTALVVQPPPQAGAEPGRQTALSVPEAIRALGEPLEPFFAACGGRQTISLSVRRRDGRAPPETCVFQQPFVLIGRCPESDLALADGAVSFRHFYLQFVGGRWLFVNLPGLSGVPGEKGRSTSGWFDAGNELTAGPYTITHVAAEQEPSTAISAPGSAEPALELPSFELALVNGRSGSQERRIPRISTSMTLIGSSRQCDVWLKDDSVSRVHASLVLTPRGLWAVDLLGRDGVLVDGRPAYWKQLHDGAVIQIGKFRLRVQFGASRGLAVRTREDHAPDRTRPKRKSHSSSGGSMSEGSVISLVKHLTEMQTQFFEHSQLQTQVITEMLTHLGRAQQTSVRQDLTRIDEIGRELQEIKSQLAKIPDESSARNDVAAASPQRQPRLETSVPRDAAHERPVQPDSRTANLAETVRADSGDSDPSMSAVPAVAEGVPGAEPNVPPRARAELPPGPQSPHATTDAHAWLSQRMANLAQERNSRWRHILNVFGRKSASSTDE